MVTDPENRGEEIGSRGNRPSRETDQAQIGTRGRGVATCRGRNAGRWTGKGVHGHGDSDPGHDWSLDLCACPGREDREDHAGRWRSTGLSAPDSYGTQPCKRCQPHLADEKNVEIEVSAKSGQSDGWPGDAVKGSESRRWSQASLVGWMVFPVCEVYENADVRTTEQKERKGGYAPQLGILGYSCGDLLHQQAQPQSGLYSRDDPRD
jgi:hypothetical protein